MKKKNSLLVLFTKLVLTTTLFISAINSLSGQIYTPGAGVNDVDGNNYQTIIINGQEWMAENLRTSKYSNGEDIPHVTDINLWSTLSNGAWIYMLNDIQFEIPFGKLYNWYTVNDNRNVCPLGWRVPSESDWNTLIGYLDPNQNPLADINNATLGVQSAIAGGKMKSTDTQYWINGNFGATNESGFTGQPGGNLESAVSNWNTTGYYGEFWSSTVYSQNSNYAWQRRIIYENADIKRLARDITFGMSIRCVKDNTTNINELNYNEIIPKKLVKITDILGKEINQKSNEIIFIHYSDGSIEKRIVVE
jgi:uncharacterized protein (TIGR02145 family)